LKKENSILIEDEDGEEDILYDDKAELNMVYSFLCGPENIDFTSMANQA
jgi:hypothetical protein